RLPDCLRDDRRRACQRDAPVRHLRLSAGRRHGHPQHGCRRVAGDVPDPVPDRDLPAALHPPRGDPLMIEGAIWRRWVFFYIPLTIFLIFLLFPFYRMVLTTLKAHWALSPA